MYNKENNLLTLLPTYNSTVSPLPVSSLFALSCLLFFLVDQTIDTLCFPWVRVWCLGQWGSWYTLRLFSSFFLSLRSLLLLELLRSFPMRGWVHCKYTTSVDIKKKNKKKTCYKASHSCRNTWERNESAQESGKQCYISDHQSVSTLYLRSCVRVEVDVLGCPS